jgi:predicted nucleic acid-binding protein
VKNSTCSSYDCEFIALAKNLNTKLITMDKKLLSEFRNFAVSLEEFLQS